MRAAAILILGVSMAGCGGPRGPASTDASSATLPTLAERVDFLHRYVAFRRGYRELDFRITCRNGAGGRVPGPSEWDIRVVAVVPPGQLASWVPAGATPFPDADRSWLADVPGADRAAKIAEWYVGPGSVVGVDRERSVVAYRRRAF